MAKLKTTTWKDGETPLSAQNMNNIENNILNLDNRLTNAESILPSADDKYIFESTLETHNDSTSVHQNLQNNLKRYSDNKIDQHDRDVNAHSSIREDILNNTNAYKTLKADYDNHVKADNNSTAHNISGQILYHNNLSNAHEENIEARINTHNTSTSAETHKDIRDILNDTYRKNDTYSKNEVLSESVKTTFGLTSSATPTDVLALLAPYTQHWWYLKAIQIATVYEEKRITQSTYTLRFYRDGYEGGNYTIYYSTEITIDQSTGKISLVNPQILNYNNVIWDEGSISSEIHTLLRGKYVQSPDGGIERGDITTDIFYIPTSGVTLYSVGPKYLSISKGDYYRVETSSYQVDVGEYMFAHSTNRNAYPDNGSDDNFEYKYIGIPLQNAVVAQVDSDMAKTIRNK